MPSDPGVFCAHTFHASNPAAFHAYARTAQFYPRRGCSNCAGSH